MKMGHEHRVSLSEPEIILHKTMPRITNENLVFLSNQHGKMLSDIALNAVMRRMKANAVPHGFLSTFRDWAGEASSFPREVCEHALAH